MLGKTIGLVAVLLAACARLVPQPPEPSPGHLRPEDQATGGQIPPVVEQTPFLPRPQPLPESEKYTVVVHEVPVKELLFALARDAQINVDIDPRIEGVATLNAVDQTFPQILDRVARQVNLRYEIQDKNVFLMPDEPYFRTYKVDYVNLLRDSTSTENVATQIATGGVTDFGSQAGGGLGGGAGNNNSTTTVKSVSNHRLWLTLTNNILAIIGDKAVAGGGGSTELPVSQNVVANAESGVINVRATSKQHEQIQAFIDSVLVNAQRQVLIEVTVVEVELSDQYQAGIDWQRLARSGGFAIGQSLLGGLQLGDLTKAVSGTTGERITSPFFALQYTDKGDPTKNEVAVTLRLLRDYGNTKVLSSPKLMVLNNQTAMLKVVDNVVYFTVEQQISQGGLVANNVTATTTKVHTVPVGLVMTVTPQVNENSGVTMNVRPTISRVTKFVPDPNPVLTVPSNIPQIQVREMESVLKINSGQIAVLGGLMQDQIRRNSSGIPFLSELPELGDLFNSRDNESVKTELVIFLRPTVIQSASLEGDLRDLRPFLERRSNFGAGNR